ncbi:ArnT family glycosyltransferase [Pseudobacteriovorax antillogorgiicola]|uniref:4-amino-4-deoxy-L-arabinose transferase n=1 Tax=Pseudobacteriovorax antillogorgiicola TaxID=1513793 RepID=A0A1Y6CID2_9BACT|nr:glycosyltransferase family 39 protein [Pseudobacteriovorax antillogorgiicola]TCS46955.1 4-amino-4-deoxy-L-arabinose transferase-like glycosyltransferase [Pseudobacteriovorax antillogorgiicola]SMF64539.1 4-amino-4-deoxy-L-arabinose transferase [Pseudobacteriovorax antillogorgiicola]
MTLQHQRMLVLIILLLPLALLINLGEHHLFVHTDEPRRALVSLEMMLSGKYMTPTLNGIYYLNKPALYSWWVAFFYWLGGDFSEWNLRLSTIAALTCYLGLAYRFVRLQTGSAIAIITTLALATNARTLYYDSFLGMIDFPFSFFAFMSMAAIFHYGEKDRDLKGYFIAYSLAAVAFLIKGLPGAAYVGITMLVYHMALKRRYGFLWSKHHILGASVFLLILAVYYGFFFLINDVSPELMFQTILSESTKRTVVRFGLGQTLLHIAYFPIDMFINFLPWNLPILLLAYKPIRDAIWQKSFFRFCIITFLANVSVYWTSPEVTPRYLHSLAPFFFAVSTGCLMEAYRLQVRGLGWLSRVMIGLGTILVVAMVAVPLFEQGRNAPEGILWAPLLYGGASGILLYGFFRQPGPEKYLYFAALLLVGRVCYSHLMLPSRAYDRQHFKDQAIALGSLTQGSPLYLYDGTWLQDGSTFYISRERQEILAPTNKICQQCYLIVYDHHLVEKPDWHSITTIETLFQDKPLHLVWTGSNTPPHQLGEIR